MEPSTMIGQEMAKADAETTFKLSSENLAKLKDLHQEVSLVVSTFNSKQPGCMKIQFTVHLKEKKPAKQNQFFEGCPHYSNIMRFLWYCVEVAFYPITFTRTSNKAEVGN